MSKYSRAYLHPSTPPRRQYIHPIWWGIGCILIILIPIISFAGARLLMQANSSQGWIGIPGGLSRPINTQLLGAVTYADLSATVILIIIGFGLLTALYALLYGLFGPPKYGPLDVPPH
jgi:hypothetical protein